MYHVDHKTKMRSKGKALMLQPLLFQLVLFGRVALVSPGWVGVPGAREGGQAAAHSSSAARQSSRICPWHRAEQHSYKSLAAAEGGVGREKQNNIVSFWQFAENIFVEVKGLVVASILLLTAVPWGNEEDKIARTEG